MGMPTYVPAITITTPDKDRIDWAKPELADVIDKLAAMRSRLAGSKDATALRAAIELKQLEERLDGIHEVLENGY